MSNLFVQEYLQRILSQFYKKGNNQMENIYSLNCSNGQLENWVKLKKENKLSNDDWSRMTSALRRVILRKVNGTKYAK